MNDQPSSLKMIFAVAIGLTMNAINSQAQERGWDIVSTPTENGAPVLSEIQINSGPSHMPSSSAFMLSYAWQKTVPNFRAVNPHSSTSGHAAADVTTGNVTEHFEAVGPDLAFETVTAADNAARGGAYQKTSTLTGRNASYNHDGRAFESHR